MLNLNTLTSKWVVAEIKTEEMLITIRKTESICRTCNGSHSVIYMLHSSWGSKVVCVSSVRKPASMWAMAQCATVPAGCCPGIRHDPHLPVHWLNSFRAQLFISISCRNLQYSLARASNSFPKISKEASFISTDCFSTWQAFSSDSSVPLKIKTRQAVMFWKSLSKKVVFLRSRLDIRNSQFKFKEYFNYKSVLHVNY